MAKNTDAYWALLVSVAGLVAPGCSGAVARHSLRVGTEPGSDGGLSGVGNAGSGVIVGDGGVAVGTNALTVHVEDIKQMTITIVTVQCAGDCADVVAVARGGHVPYSFKWEDGSTAAARRVCPSTSAHYSVAATDTAITGGEFPYEAHSAIADVTARVLQCADAGTADAGAPGGTLALCTTSASPAFKVMTQVASAATTTFLQANGNISDYRMDSVAGTQLAIVQRAQIVVDIGKCTQLLLAGDAAATTPVGWDNLLLVEVRLIPGGPVVARVDYGSPASLVYVPSAQTLVQPVAATVSGLSLNPPVPNFVPFGYPPLAIDLMQQVPAGVSHFELTLYVLDSGGFGSTTDIWAIPR